MKKPTKKTVDRWAAHDGAMLKKGAEIAQKKIADWMKTKLPADHWLVTQIESGAYGQGTIGPPHESLAAFVCEFRRELDEDDEPRSVFAVRVESARETTEPIAGYPYMRTKARTEPVDLDLIVPHRTTRGELATALEAFAGKLRDPET